MSCSEWKETCIGKIPKHWVVKTIDEIKSNSKNSIAMGPFGSRIKSDNFVEEGVPVIRGVNISKEKLFEEDYVFLTEDKADELKSSNVFEGYIIFTHRGTLGQVGIIPKNSKYKRYVVSQSQMKLSCNRDIVEPEWVYYFFKSKIGQHQLLSNTSTTGVPAIARPTTTLKLINIPIPPKDEQIKLIKILENIDDKIELNNEMNKTLEEIAQSIFKRWFVDFEFPNENGKSYKSSGGDMVESELGMIPRGWNITLLGNIIDITSGKRPKKKSKEKDCEFNIPLIGASSIMGYTNDILYSEKILVIGRVGTHGIVQRFNENVWPSDNTFVIKSRHYEYINQVLNNIDYTSLNVGSTQPLITQTDIKNIEIVQPNEDVIIKFESVVSSFYHIIDSNKRNNIYLEETRNILINKLISGDIKVQ